MKHIEGWATHAEHPGAQMAAAIRASRTAERRVADKAFDYQSALARGDVKGARAAQAALRSAWEVDIRRKGGRPEDFVPGYPDYNVNVAPVQVGFFGDYIRRPGYLAGISANWAQE